MLTQRMQIQALADRLAGLPASPSLPVSASLSPRSFTEPWLTCWLAIDSAEPHLANHALVQALAAYPERERILQMILSARPGYAPSFPSLADLSPGLQPIEWLWPGWIPRGMLTIFGASQGSGKSFVALDLAYRIIHGLPFPDGSPSTREPRTATSEPRTATSEPRTANREPPNVLYIDAEMVPQILDERAQNYQLDRSHLFLLLPDSYEMIDFGDDKYKDRLVEMVSLLQPALIIVDSLSSIHSRGQNNVEDVRGLLGFLAQLAASYHTALLLIHHIRKPGAGQSMLQFDLAMEDLSGSGHITAMARVVLGLHVIQTGPTFDPNGPRELKMLKTNLGPFEKPLGFEFAPLHPKGVYIKWTNAPAQTYQEPTKSDECVQWLLETLQDASHPLTPKDIIEKGEEYGFSRRTIFRARDSLSAQIRNTLGRRHPANAWELAPLSTSAANGEGKAVLYTAGVGSGTDDD